MQCPIHRAQGPCIGSPGGRNNEISQNNPGIRMGHSTVMLSTFATLSVNSAKHLAAQRDRPFASLRVTVEGLSCFAALSISLPSATDSSLRSEQVWLRVTVEGPISSDVPNNF